MKLAYDAVGRGPPVIIVLGAFNTRDMARPLANALADAHTVVIYDRRGKGESGDEPEYSVDKEVADIAWLISQVGPSSLLGFSSGAALALRAHHLTSKLALLDLPLRPDPRDHVGALKALLADGRRADAVEYFQRDMVGIPPAVIAQLKQAPFWPALVAMAHTLVYEATIIRDGVAASPSIPVLSLYSDERFRAASEAVGNAEHVPGIGHNLSPTLAPRLKAFYAATA